MITSWYNPTYIQVPTYTPVSTIVRSKRTPLQLFRAPASQNPNPNEFSGSSNVVDDGFGRRRWGRGMVSCFCFLLFLLCFRAHSPSLPALSSGQCNSSRACRPWQGRSPRYGCRSRAWKVSYSLLLCSFVTMPRSRPARALPFPPLLANAAVAGAAGRWFAGRDTPEARPLLRVGCDLGRGRGRGCGRGP